MKKFSTHNAKSDGRIFKIEESDIRASRSKQKDEANTICSGAKRCPANWRSIIEPGCLPPRLRQQFSLLSVPCDRGNGFWPTSRGAFMRVRRAAACPSQFAYNADTIAPRSNRENCR